MASAKSETPQFRHAQANPDDRGRAARFVKMDKAASDPMKDPRRKTMVAARSGEDRDGRVRHYLHIDRKSG